MARNLVEEKHKEIEVPKPKEETKVEEPSENVRVITENQAILNQQGYIIKSLEEIKVMMLEGFKQVGVKF